MGREVRRVPADWVHPEGKPLHDGFTARLAQWDADKAAWDRGEQRDWIGGGYKPKGAAALESESFEDWSGHRPDPDDYMPDWPAEQRTHFQMYETTTEGTPISPVMASPEELARWLADTGASAFGSQTASYEGWLRVCLVGYAPSAVIVGNVMMSGVDGIGGAT